MPKVSALHREQMRDRLVEAARVCLATRGYEATSARDILNEAGVSAGTLYNYFESKDELFVAVADRFGQAVRPESKRAKDPDDALAQVVARNFIEDRPPSLQPALRARAAFDERIGTALRRYDKSVEEGLRQLLEEARDRGSLRSDVDIQALIELVAVCFEGFEGRLASGGVRTSRKRVGSLLVELLATSVTTPHSRLRRRLMAISKAARGRVTR